MAYDSTTIGAYSSRTAFQMMLYVRRDQTDNANNRSTYAYGLYQINTSSYASWELDSRMWYVSVGGDNFTGSINCDFRGYTDGAQRYITDGSGNWQGHDADGYLNLTFAFEHPYGGSFGTAKSNSILYTDRIPKPPAPGSAPTYSQITPTTARASWGPSGNNNGSAVLDYLLRLHTNPNVTAAGYVDYQQNTLFKDLTGLKPGVTYYAAVYPRNAIGYGARTATTSFKTLSGAYVGKSSSFQGAEVLVGKGGVFVTASIYIGKGGTFVLAT